MAALKMVRDMDESAYAFAKAESAIRRVSIGEVISMALRCRYNLASQNDLPIDWKNPTGAIQKVAVTNSSIANGTESTVVSSPNTEQYAVVPAHNHALDTERQRLQDDIQKYCIDSFGYRDKKWWEIEAEDFTAWQKESQTEGSEGLNNFLAEYKRATWAFKRYMHWDEGKDEDGEPDTDTRPFRYYYLYPGMIGQTEWTPEIFAEHGQKIGEQEHKRSKKA